MQTRSPIDAGAGRDTALLQIATAAIHLGALGPHLSRLAHDMAAESTDQARLAKAVADNMRALTEHLETATQQMRGASVEVESALTTVSRIAQHTKIIAINATIEAARAGAHGVAFGVVVEEVQRLAERTSATTAEIESRVRDLQTSIARVTAITTDTERHDEPADHGSSVARANARIQHVADAAARQLTAIGSLRDMSGNVKSVTDTLVMAVGTFRFAAHQRAERELGELMRDLGPATLDRPRVEHLLERWIERHPHFELAYVTGPGGRQIVDNIRCANGRASHESSGLHRDWSSRPWYREAVAHRDAQSTDVYRSAATGDFCFTIAAALRAADGALRGVVAADVNFRELLSR